MVKPWFLVDWIFKATELGKKYYKAVKCEHDKIIDIVGKLKKMRETAEKGGQIEDKPSVTELLIQYGDMGKEEIVGEIATIIGAGSDTTAHACGYVLAFLGENQHIQESVMQGQQDIFGDDILRPVRSDDLPRMVYLEQVGNRLLCASLFSSNIYALHRMKLL
jgi:cytochrome P450